MIQNPKKIINEVCYASSSAVGPSVQQDMAPACRSEVRASPSAHTAQKEKVKYEDFDVIKALGEGSYGKVFLARKRGGADDKKLYAMKVIKKPTLCLSGQLIRSIQSERRVLELVRGFPFLAKMEYAFQTDRKLFLVMHYLNGGDISTHIHRFTEADAKFYIAEIIIALQILHQRGIVHRDVKLSNILLDEDGHIVLVDYGCAKQFMRNDTRRRTYTFCGTLEYNAPEILRRDFEGYGMAVDWWSLGIVAHELLTIKSPFRKETLTSTRPNLANKIINEDPQIQLEEDSLDYDFVKALLKKIPEERLGGGVKDAEDVKAHPFLRDINWGDLISKRLPAPFRPTVLHELDTSNFNDEEVERSEDASELMDHETVNYTQGFHRFSFVGN